MLTDHFKKPQSALMTYLESKIVTQPPQKVDVIIIDAMFFLHLNSNLPATFGGVANYLLTRIMNAGGSIIHFIADKWTTPTIKGIERMSRSISSPIFQIKGSSQQRPSDWLAALNNTLFKESLISFLVEDWQDDKYASTFVDKELIANFNDTCYKFFSSNGRVIREELPYLYSMQEEADSHMFFHLANIQAPSNVVIRTDDTDCVVIGLALQGYMNESVNVWLEVGKQFNNNLRFISLKQLSSNLGRTLCAALPAYHALTGCDYTASFCRCGKVKPLKLLEKRIDFQNAHCLLGAQVNCSEADIQIEEYVCSMYVRNKISSLSEARLDIFLQKYKPNGKENRIGADKVKKMDGTTMPPCRTVFLERTCFIANMWMSSRTAHPPRLNPLDYGWKTNEHGEYEIDWFKGEACPKSLDVLCEEANDLEEADDVEVSDDDGSYSTDSDDTSSDEHD